MLLTSSRSLTSRFIRAASRWFATAYLRIRSPAGPSGACLSRSSVFMPSALSNETDVMADVGEELVSRRHQPVGDVAFANHVLVRRFALDGQEVCEEPGASRALLVELRIGVRAL